VPARLPVPYRTSSSNVRDPVVGRYAHTSGWNHQDSDGRPPLLDLATGSMRAAQPITSSATSTSSRSPTLANSSERILSNRSRLEMPSHRVPLRVTYLQYVYPPAHHRRYLRTCGHSHPNQQRGRSAACAYFSVSSPQMHDRFISRPTELRAHQSPNETRALQLCRRAVGCAVQESRN
jgi:hypothetical protein